MRRPAKQIQLTSSMRVSFNNTQLATSEMQNEHVLLYKPIYSTSQILSATLGGHR